MKKVDIKKLARVSFEKGTINKNILGFVLKKLSKAQLKQFLFFLKQETNKNIVLVISAKELDAKQKRELNELFKNKVVDYKTDDSLGAGIVVKSEDTIMDASIKGIINQTINTLKQ